MKRLQIKKNKNFKKISKFIGLKRAFNLFTLCFLTHISSKKAQTPTKKNPLSNKRFFPFFLHMEQINFKLKCAQCPREEDNANIQISASSTVLDLKHGKMHTIQNYCLFQRPLRCQTIQNIPTHNGTQYGRVFFQYKPHISFFFFFFPFCFFLALNRAVACLACALAEGSATARLEIYLLRIGVGGQ